LSIVFIDSCVVIDFMRGDDLIKERLLLIDKPCINYIVEMELIRGANNKRELNRIEMDLNFFKRLPFHDAVADLSTALIRDYSLSHNLQIPDAIIAATCLVYDIPLYTHNLKDFRFIHAIKLFK